MRGVHLRKLRGRSEGQEEATGLLPALGPCEGGGARRRVLRVPRVQPSLDGVAAMSAIGVAERFWAKVRKGEGCWEWTASRRGGYGQMQAGATGRTPGAHRISWELHFGEIPAGMCVCHRCDNRLCVRPDHLFLGTRDDNQKDMARKGRAASGPRCSASKLSGLQVECARTLAGRGRKPASHRGSSRRHADEHRANRARGDLEIARGSR
jgi:hypothetical protein